MIGFWIAVVVLTALAVWWVARPLLKPTAEQTTAADHARQVYADQLAEIERDLGRGVLTADQARAARAEVGRRLLAAAAEAERTAPALGRMKSSPAMAAVLALLVPASAVGIYLALGNPELSEEVARAAVENDAETGHIEQAAAGLAARLAQNPDDPDGWRLLGRSYTTLRRFDEAAEAYRRALELRPADLDLAGAYAEGLAQAANGMVTEEARSRFAAILEKSPGDPRARYFLALARYQAGDLRGALEAWSALMVDSPADAAWVPFLREDIRKAAVALNLDPEMVTPQPRAVAAIPSPDSTPLPGAAIPPGPGGAAGVGAPALTGDQVQAMMDLPPEERQATIRSMVERLAARLAEQPADPEGWQRLARAYRVLGDAAQAAEAEANAARYAQAAASAPPPAAEAAHPAAQPGPTPEQVQAITALPPDQQTQMIRDMVAGLAARLDAQPDDVDGWLRLSRSYEVLGETDRSREALAKAVALAPDRPDVLLAQATQMLAEDGSRPPEAFFDIMRRVLAAAPENQQALWYLGLDAAERGDVTMARGYWTRLLAQLPEGSPDRQELQRRIDGLPTG